MTELLTSKEAATLLKCAETTIHSYVRKGILRTTKNINGKRLFDREKILSFNRPSRNTSFNKRKKAKNDSASSRPRCAIGMDSRVFLDIVEKYRVNSSDTTSADVQIGVYTEKISRLEIKLRQTPTEDPDFKTMRYSLLWHVGERRKLLHYLEISNYGRYRKAIALLQKEGQVA
jgi:ribosomal protein S15